MDKLTLQDIEKLRSAAKGSLVPSMEKYESSNSRISLVR